VDPDPSWNPTILMIHRCAIGQGTPPAPHAPRPDGLWACLRCREWVDPLDSFVVEGQDVYHLDCHTAYHLEHPNAPMRYRIKASSRLLADIVNDTRRPAFTFTSDQPITATLAPPSTGHRAMP
jgi:hypothetical protein